MKYLVSEMWYDYEGEVFEPRFITDDWKKNYPKNYQCRVYEILDNGEIGEIVKEFDQGLEKGMCFGYYPLDSGLEPDDFTFIKKYPNLTDKDEMPKEIKEKFQKIGGELDTDWAGTSECTMEDKKGNKFWVYGEYHDNVTDFTF